MLKMCSHKKGFKMNGWFVQILKIQTLQIKIDPSKWAKENIVARETHLIQRIHMDSFQ